MNETGLNGTDRLKSICLSRIFEPNEQQIKSLITYLLGDQKLKDVCAGLRILNYHGQLMRLFHSFIDESSLNHIFLNSKTLVINMVVILSVRSDRLFNDISRLISL